MVDWYEAYKQLSSREKEDFARIVNHLLGATFLVRREETRRDYYFVERHQAIVEGYLRLMDWELVLDKGYGVCQAVNRRGGTRLTMSLWDTVLLLVLRLLYEEKRKQLQVAADVMARTEEIHTKVQALRLRDRGVLEKKYLRSAFALFRRHNLVEVLDGDVTDPECRFLIYPSILFAVRLESLQELHARLDEFRGEEEASEAADGAEAD